MTKDEILKRCEEWFAAYMHDRESYVEATVLLAALRNGPSDEPSESHSLCIRHGKPLRTDLGLVVCDECMGNAENRGD